MNTMYVTGSFPGGNPQDEGSIFQKGKNSFVVRPECELADAPAYKFRMDITVVNSSQKPDEIYLQIDWNEPKYMYLRTGAYVRTVEYDNGWAYVNGTHLPGTNIIEIRLTVSPGKTDISALPRYDFLQLIDQLLML